MYNIISLMYEMFACRVSLWLARPKKVSLSFAFPQLCRTLPRHGSPWKSCTRTASPRWSFWRATWWKRAVWRKKQPYVSSMTVPTSSAMRNACWKWRPPSQVGCCTLDDSLFGDATNLSWFTTSVYIQDVVLTGSSIHLLPYDHRKTRCPLAYKLSHKLVSLQRYGSSRGERNLRPVKVPSMFCEYLIGHLWYHT